MHRPPTHTHTTPHILSSQSAFQRVHVTDPERCTNTSSEVRLVPAQSVPVLPILPNQPSQPSCTGPTSSRIPANGRMAFTPQLSRHAYREQSNPCLPLVRSYTQPGQQEPDFPRNRLWSLSENGSFKREDGVEDIERSVSEINMTESYLEFKEDDEAFDHSQEEDEQEADQTLTTDALHSGLHSSTSPPIIVPSPHSSSQPEATAGSAEDLHCDSGFESLPLSLSCSPQKVNFTLGSTLWHLLQLQAHNQTDLTSLSRAASTSPVHTSPSSRKNSASSGTGSGFFNGKPRPRSSGSLKESRPKRGPNSPQCGPQSARMNSTTPAQSSGSGRGTRREEQSPIPVRRMSSSAAVIFELLKDFLGSP